MVSRIIISIALLCSSVAFSQEENGLTFSQVLLLDISTEQIVPEGKIWKVVSCQRRTSTPYADRMFYINGAAFYISVDVIPDPTTIPLWLPSGTSITDPYNLDFLNIIEFNTD